MIVESLVYAFKFEGAKKVAKEVEKLQKATEKTTKETGQAVKQLDKASDAYKKSATAENRLARIKADKTLRLLRQEQNALKRQTQELKRNTLAKKANAIAGAGGRALGAGAGALGTAALAGGAAAAGAAAGGAAAAFASVVELGNEADAIKNFAASMGVTTEEFQKLSFAAAKNGLEVEQLRGGFNQLSARIRLFQQAGSKASKTPLASALRDLNVNVKDFIKAKPARQLELMADAYAKLEPSARKNAAVAQVFGEEAGAKFAELLGGGSKALRELGDMAERYGTVLSDDALESSDLMAEGLVELRQAFKGVRFAIAQELLPTAVKLTTWLREYLVENRKLIRQKVASLFKRIEQAVKNAQPAMKSLALLAGKLLDAFNNLSPKTQGWVTTLGAATAATGALNSATGGLGSSLIKLATSNPWAALTVAAAGFTAAITNQYIEMRKAQEEAAKLEERYANGLGARAFEAGRRGQSISGLLEGSTLAERGRAERLLREERSRLERGGPAAAGVRGTRSQQLEAVKIAIREIEANRAKQNQKNKLTAFERGQKAAAEKANKLTEELIRKENEKTSLRRLRVASTEEKKKTSDLDIAKLIAQAAKRGISLDQALKGRKIAGNAPPAVVVTVNNNSTNIDVGDFVVQSEGSDPRQVASFAMQQFKDMLSEELRLNSRSGVKERA